ncbi:MAG: MBL fold metallo-hydrolase [Opitutaceae bacterium]|nr:MBL fold metallo-hydrolase [Opitutaceae bacterium]
MIRPVLQDDAFLADVAAIRADLTSPRLFVWWLGQSGFLVCYRSEFLLFDPYLSDSLTKKYAATDKPHVRMTERVVDPARLDFVSAVTSSHNHTDHLDAETLGPLFAAAPAAKLVLPAANVAFVAQRLGPAAAARFVPLADGQRATVGAFTFEAVPAAHEELAPEFAGFVVSVGAFRLYHSGDTVRFPGMVERLRPFGLDLALLPINGRAPERRVSGNLDGPEAARLAHAIGARWVVPCHYEMFAFNTASPLAFVAECGRLGQPHAVLRAGARWSLAASAADLSSIRKT